MIDLRAARNDPDAFRAALARKGAADLFDELLEADRAVRDVQSLEQQLNEAEVRRKDLLDRVPNPPDEATPDGFEEDDAVEIRRVGDPPSFDFPTRDHIELASIYGWPLIDMERGAKVSGSRFAYRVGDVALLELALYRFAMERLVQRGFTPVLPPVLVREDAMYGTGFLPTDEMNIYAIERDELYLTGTSEVAIAAMHADEILDEDA